MQTHQQTETKRQPSIAVTLAPYKDADNDNDPDDHTLTIKITGLAMKAGLSTNVDNWQYKAMAAAKDQQIQALADRVQHLEEALRAKQQPKVCFTTPNLTATFEGDMLTVKQGVACFEVCWIQDIKQDDIKNFIAGKIDELRINKGEAHEHIINHIEMIYLHEKSYGGPIIQLQGDEWRHLALMLLHGNAITPGVRGRRL